MLIALLLMIGYFLFIFSLKEFKADEQFKKQMNLFMDCFPNIFVMVAYNNY